MLSLTARGKPQRGVMLCPEFATSSTLLASANACTASGRSLFRQAFTKTSHFWHAQLGCLKLGQDCDASAICRPVQMLCRYTCTAFPVGLDCFARPHDIFQQHLSGRSCTKLDIDCIQHDLLQFASNCHWCASRDDNWRSRHIYANPHASCNANVSRQEVWKRSEQGVRRICKSIA